MKELWLCVVENTMLSCIQLLYSKSFFFKGTISYSGSIDIQLLKIYYDAQLSLTLFLSKKISPLLQNNNNNNNNTNKKIESNGKWNFENLAFT